eukprot:2680845-Prymnesium_polylepis.1
MGAGGVSVLIFGAVTCRTCTCGPYMCARVRFRRGVVRAARATRPRRPQAELTVTVHCVGRVAALGRISGHCLLRD